MWPTHSKVLILNPTYKGLIALVVYYQWAQHQTYLYGWKNKDTCSGLLCFFGLLFSNYTVFPELRNELSMWHVCIANRDENSDYMIQVATWSGTGIILEQERTGDHLLVAAGKWEEESLGPEVAAFKILSKVIYVWRVCCIGWNSGIVYCCYMGWQMTHLSHQPDLLPAWQNVCLRVSPEVILSFSHLFILLVL